MIAGAYMAINKIKIMSIGGGGCNAVNHMIISGVSAADFIAVHMEKHILDRSIAPVKLNIGDNQKGYTEIIGSDAAARAAEKNSGKIFTAIESADLIIIIAGMGGIVGTGASPAIAKTAKNHGIGTVGIVTKPFEFESKKKMMYAEKGISEMMKYTDTLITIPCDELLKKFSKKLSVTEAFREVDEVLKQKVEIYLNIVKSPTNHISSP